MCSFRKKVDDNQMCAFDLLATVAGKLLLEDESSPSSSDRLTEKELSPTLQVSIEKEQQDEDKILRVEPCGHSFKSRYRSPSRYRSRCIGIATYR